MTIIEYIASLFGDFQQFAFFKYIIAGILLLIIFDAFISLIFGALQALFRGR